jgi:hypothetical protein
VKVFLDSVYIGEAPALFPEITAGSHVMEFSKDGFSSMKKDVVVNPGKTTNVMVALPYGETETAENTSSFPWIPVIVVMIGLIVIAIGGYYYWSETKKNGWGMGKNPKAGDTKNHVPARKDTVVKDIIIREPEVRKTTVDTTTARIPQASNTAASDIPAKEPETKNMIINNTAAPEPEIRQPAISDTSAQEPEAGNTIVSDKAAHEPKARKNAARDTTVRKPKVSNSVVRVTLLKDIPDKEQGDDDTRDKHE